MNTGEDMIEKSKAFDITDKNVSDENRSENEYVRDNANGFFIDENLKRCENMELKCEIVRDLLPSYVDGLTCSITNEAVESHVDECGDCKSVLERMREPELNEQAEEVQVDYLKKYRRRSKRWILTGIILAVLLLIGLYYARIYFIGDETFTDMISYDVAVDGNTLDFSGEFVEGSLFDKYNGYTRTSFDEKDGIVTITVYVSPRTFFNDTTFDEQYRSKDEIKEIFLGDMLIWEHGNSIGRTAASLYAAKNPYVGDMPANGRVSSAIGVATQFGNFTNELQTTTEPYGWTLVFSTEIKQYNENISREIMKADSYLMLAAINNLGYVTWKYNTLDGEQSYTVTADEASVYSEEYVGKDIKTCMDTASDVQRLVQSLRIYD